MRAIRALATDIDGTITDTGSRICIEAIEAIRDLEDHGIRVIICSGNALCALKSLAIFLGCSGPIVAENGGVVEYKGRIMRLGDKEYASAAIRELRSAFGADLKEVWSNPYRLVDAAVKRNIEFERVKEVVGRLKGTKVIDSGFAYHVMDERVNKGAGLIEAARWIGLDPGSVAGVGDSSTDLELLREAGFKAVVANGDPLIKEMADYVAREPFGYGFAEIAKHVLSLRS